MVKLFILGFMLSYTILVSAQTPLSETLTTKDGLISNRGYDLQFSDDGLIWIANGNGLSAFNGIAFTNYELTDTSQQITGIAIHGSGLFCHSGDGNIYRVSGAQFADFKLQKATHARLQTQLINDLFVTKDKLWVSTLISGGIYRINFNGEIEATFSSDSKYIGREISDNQIITGSNQSTNNTLQFHTLTGDSIVVNLSIQEGPSKSKLVRFNQNEFLFSNSYELIRFDLSGKTERTFLTEQIETLFVDREGRLWVGLNQGGVLLFSEHSLDQNSSVHYLGNKTITGIGQDHEGNLWFSSINNGIQSLSYNMAGAYVAPTIFASHDTSTSVGIQTDASIKISDDVASKILATDTGRYDTLPPSIFITGIKIHERDTVLANRLELAHDQNYLTVQFAGFSRVNKEKLRYKYRLHGIDDNWIFSNNSFANYPTLPPGHYIFEVGSVSNRGVWSLETKTLVIDILPPYWETLWFLVCVLAIVVATVLLVMFFWISRIKKREQRKIEHEKEIAGVQLKALSAQMNPHFMFNTLSSIQNFITTNNSEMALRYLSKFSKLMRKVLDHSQKNAIPLQSELDALELYLQLEAFRFGNKFSYSINVAPGIDRNYEEVPSMLIQPYIENAILHGISHKKETDGFIQVDLTLADKSICCTITDNGIGRVASKEINKNRSHKSSGMSLTAERLTILNSVHGSDLSVTIEDRIIDTKISGTIVTLHIPIKQ